MRAIRTDGFLYIRNFAVDRWPTGGPARNYRDCDGGPSKTFLLKNRDKPAIRPFFEMAFAKRPAEELYDLQNDPHQLKNVAAQAGFSDIRSRLSRRLLTALKASRDPRVTSGGENFDRYPYLGRTSPRKTKRKSKRKKKRS